MLEGFAENNPIYMMADSGARGSKTQLRQLPLRLRQDVLLQITPLRIECIQLPCHAGGTRRILGQKELCPMTCCPPWHPRYSFP